MKQSRKGKTPRDWKRKRGRWADETSVAAETPEALNRHEYVWEIVSMCCSADKISAAYGAAIDWMEER
ncbi:hypothetical protein [Hyphococcus sp.]|uniref:hypothetical protein n=1 Tax=Hyphococcus sp. TaxID=2038636 RepID=UPI003CCC1EC8